MLFRYQITLDLDVEFEAPLLGADTTESKRKLADSIVKKALQEMITLKNTLVLIDREVEHENLKGTIKGHKSLSKSEKNKY